jgi:hypothetical protein
MSHVPARRDLDRDLVIVEMLPNASHATFKRLETITHSYAEPVQAQPIDAAMPLHHAELVELLFSGSRAASDVPFLGPHGLAEALVGAIRASAISP